MDEEEETSLEKKYIEFIDPDQLVTFVQDENLELAEKEAEPTEEAKDERHFEKEILSDDLSQTLSQSISENTILEKKENTRGRLAIIYTLATFFIFLVGIAASILDGLVREVSIIENLKEVIPLLSGVFLGTLGFVLGYYFRTSDENNN